MVFITWSGEISKQIALLLQDWIPDVIQAVKEPFMSDSSIQAGKRWFPEISDKLQNSKFGIICLTRTNLNEPWIHFEAGALSKVVSESRVVPYLFHIEPSDIPSGPLSQFQAKRCTQKETLDLIKSLNEALGDKALSDKNLDKSFKKWWPKLKEGLRKVPTEEKKEPVRKAEDMIREILETVKGISRTLSLSGTTISDINLDNLLKSGLTTTQPWEKRGVASYLKSIGQPKARSALANFLADKQNENSFKLAMTQLVDSWEPPNIDEIETEPNK